MRGALKCSPLKYIAGFRPSSSPRVVARDSAVYKSPSALPSHLFSSGSHTITWNMFGILPGSTGPADSPWNLCMVLAYASVSGRYSLLHWWQLSHLVLIVGMGTNCLGQWVRCVLCIATNERAAPQLVY